MPPWLKRLIGLVVTLAVLGGICEFALRMIYPGIIQTAVGSALKLPPSHEVDVSLGGVQLISAMTGGVGDVTVTVPDAPLVEGVEGDVVLSAAKVPFNPAKGEIEDASVTLSLPQDQLDPLVSMVTEGVASTGAVTDDTLVVGSTAQFFGQTVEFSAAVALSAVDGDVEVEPAGVNVAGFSMTAEELGSVTGSLLDPVLQPQLVCVRDRLPRGVTVTSIDLSTDGKAVVRADLAPGIASDPAEREKGTCE